MSDVPFPRAMRRYPRLRQSLLSTFDDCALQSHFEALYRNGWDTHPQGRGQLFHRFASKALIEMRAQGEERIEVDVALAILHEVLRQADVDDVCHEPDCELPARIIPPSKRRKDGRALLCAAGHRHHSDVVNVPTSEIKDLYWIVKKWAYDQTFDIHHLMFVERRLTATVRYPNPQGGSVERLITGQVDALFVDPEDATHAIVIDHKDTWKLPAPTEVSFEGYFQQRFYGLLVMRNFRQIQKVTLREFYVRRSEPREATITREILDDIDAEIAAIVERFDQAVERSIYKPTPGRHCNFCMRPTACPIPVAVRGEGRVTDAKQAERLAAQVVVAEVVLEQTRKALASYAEFHGPVPVKDSKGRSVYGFRHTARVERPSYEEAQRAEVLGVPLSSLYKRKTGTRFEKMTIHPDEQSAEDDVILRALQDSAAGAKKP